jgi:hypothetical protein
MVQLEYKVFHIGLIVDRVDSVDTHQCCWPSKHGPVLSIYPLPNTQDHTGITATQYQDHACCMFKKFMLDQYWFNDFFVVKICQILAWKKNYFEYINDFFHE